MTPYLILCAVALLAAKGRDARVCAVLLTASCALSNLAYVQCNGAQTFCSVALYLERFHVDAKTSQLLAATDAMTCTYVMTLFWLRHERWTGCLTLLLAFQLILHAAEAVGLGYAAYSALLDASFAAQLLCVISTGKGRLDACRDWLDSRRRHRVPGSIFRLVRPVSESAVRLGGAARPASPVNAEEAQ